MILQVPRRCVRRNVVRFVFSKTDFQTPVQRGAQVQGFGEGTTPWPARMPAVLSKIKDYAWPTNQQCLQSPRGCVRLIRIPIHPRALEVPNYITMSTGIASVTHACYSLAQSTRDPSPEGRGIPSQLTLLYRPVLTQMASAALSGL